MQYRIEVQDPQHTDRWGPALSNIGGYGAESSLTPERLSTFDIAEVAFEKVAELARLQPLSCFRIVDAASGIVIWGPGERITFEEHQRWRDPATGHLRYPDSSIAASAERDGIGGQFAVAQARMRERAARLVASLKPKEREVLANGMPSVKVAQALGATPNEAAEAFVADACRKFLNVLAPEAIDSLKQIIEAQEAFCDDLHRLAKAVERTREAHPDGQGKTVLEIAYDNAHKVLRDLRALAKKLGVV